MRRSNVVVWAAIAAIAFVVFGLILILDGGQVGRIAGREGRPESPEVIPEEKTSALPKLDPMADPVSGEEASNELSVPAETEGSDVAKPSSSKADTHRSAAESVVQSLNWSGSSDEDLIEHNLEKIQKNPVLNPGGMPLDSELRQDLLMFVKSMHAEFEPLQTRYLDVTKAAKREQYKLNYDLVAKSDLAKATAKAYRDELVVYGSNRDDPDGIYRVSRFDPSVSDEVRDVSWDYWQHTDRMIQMVQEFFSNGGSR
ncbi:MAG: hypothetical protein RL885_12685 [Planctomycetota bacterium]